MYPGIASFPAFKHKAVEAIDFREAEKKVIDPTLIPSVNISEFPSEYLIQIAVSGLKREEFSIELKEGVISIAAKKKQEDMSCINDRCEFDYHDWTRAFILPADADAIMAQAIYQNGELSIRIPRNDAAECKAAVFITVY